MCVKSLRYVQIDIQFAFKLILFKRSKREEIRGSERRKITARTRNQHMRSVHSPFSFTSFPSQFTSLQSFLALNDRVRHPLKVRGLIPFFHITKHYRSNRVKVWVEGMATWQSVILCKPLLESQGFLRGMAWWVQHILVIENWAEIVQKLFSVVVFHTWNFKRKILDDSFLGKAKHDRFSVIFRQHTSKTWPLNFFNL